MHSMTGYGKGSLQQDGREITIELKSVNHRFLDLNYKFPRHLSFLEDLVREDISAALFRGHVDIYIFYQNTRDDALSVSVNLPLLHAYKQAYSTIISNLQLSESPRLSNFVSIPRLIDIQETQDDAQQVRDLTKQALALALDQLREMRAKEGMALKADLHLQLTFIKEQVQALAALAPRVPLNYKNRLEERLKQLNTSPIEPQRLAQEVALYADKVAIDEEVSRLDSHIEQMFLLLDKKDEVGRKLDFLLQEMNREINTIGSKASDIDITNHVVAVKSALEKMKEQGQNVE